LNGTPELLEDVVHPALLESQAQISEDIGEMQEQIRKQVTRLRELRIKKIEEPGEALSPLLYLQLAYRGRSAF
jgi:elongator complex protein 1